LLGLPLKHRNVLLDAVVENGEVVFIERPDQLAAGVLDGDQHPHQPHIDVDNGILR
jgi:hypothetical protein